MKPDGLPIHLIDQAAKGVSSFYGAVFNGLIESENMTRAEALTIVCAMIQSSPPIQQRPPGAPN